MKELKLEKGWNSPAAAITILERAKKLIDSGWTQGAFARDMEGHACPLNTGKAVSYCITGAITTVRNPFTGSAGIRALKYTLRELCYLSGWTTLAAFNDATRRTKYEIITLMDRGIEHFRREAQ